MLGIPEQVREDPELAVRTEPLRNMKRPRRSLSRTSMMSSSPGLTGFLNFTSVMRVSTGV